MIKKISYAVSIVLMIGYFMALFVSLRYSGKSFMYENYYLSDNLGRYTSEEEFKTTYIPNREILYTADGNFRNQGVGWSGTEANATWAVGDKSTFCFYVQDIKTEYLIRIILEGRIGYENELYINGVDIGPLIFSDSSCEVPVPAELLVAGLNVFTIKAKEEVLNYNIKNPNATDTRKLNLYVHSIELVENLKS